MTETRKQQILQQLRERVIEMNQNRHKPNRTQIDQMKQQLQNLAPDAHAEHACISVPQRTSLSETVANAD